MPHPSRPAWRNSKPRSTGALRLCILGAGFRQAFLFSSSVPLSGGRCWQAMSRVIQPCSNEASLVLRVYRSQEAGGHLTNTPCQWRQILQSDSYKIRFVRQDAAFQSCVAFEIRGVSGRLGSGRR
jgi:hypothetical protein